MSVVPSDSVSQNGESRVGPGQPTLSISPPVYPGADVLAAVGPARYAERLASYERLMEVYYKQVSSYLAAYQSYCRLNSDVSLLPAVSPSSPDGSVASSSSSSGSSSVRSAASSFSRFRTGLPGVHMGKSAVRKLARAMRVKGVSARLPGGYCYARLVRPEARESVAVSLGPYPALGDLLSRPREEFLPRTASSAVALAVGPDGVAHVDYVGRVSDALSFNDVASALAIRSEFEFGSYGHSLLSSAGVVKFDYDASTVSLETPVGGTSVSPASVVGPCSPLPPAGVDTVFLAGSSEKDASPGWRSAAASRFAAPWTVVTPRPFDLQDSWGEVMRRDYVDSERHLWESRAMSSATAVVFAFLPDAVSACSLAELASMPPGSNVYVGCSPGYVRRSYVEYLCARGRFVLLDSVSQVLDAFGSCLSADCRSSVVPDFVQLSSRCLSLTGGSSVLRFPALGEPVLAGSAVTVVGVSPSEPRLVLRSGEGYVSRDVAWLRSEAVAAFEAADFSGSLALTELAAHLGVYRGDMLPEAVPAVGSSCSGAVGRVSCFRIV